MNKNSDFENLPSVHTRPVMLSEANSTSDTVLKKKKKQRPQSMNLHPPHTFSSRDMITEYLPGVSRSPALWLSFPFSLHTLVLATTHSLQWTNLKSKTSQTQDEPLPNGGPAPRFSSRVLNLSYPLPLHLVDKHTDSRNTHRRCFQTYRPLEHQRPLAPSRPPSRASASTNTEPSSRHGVVQRSALHALLLVTFQLQLRKCINSFPRLLCCKPTATCWILLWGGLEAYS